MNLLRAAIRGIVQSTIVEAAAKRRDVELPASDVAKEEIRKKIQSAVYNAISKGDIVDDKSLKDWLHARPARDPVTKSAILALRAIPYSVFKQLASIGKL